MLLLSFAALAGAPGCEDSLAPMVDGGVGRRLDILDPPGSQIGLRFSRSLDLAVRYVIDDATERPLRNEPVHFAIFDDPVGSTLSRDVVNTDDSGLAVVTLNGGTQEGAFRVRATASGAADAEFSISISELEFVEIDAQLEDPLPTPGARNLHASLYVDKTCADLAPMPMPLGAARTLEKASAATATLAFVNLLSRTYAVVGTVEAAGHLDAYGCLDVDRALGPPGAHLRLPVRMAAISPTVTGDFDLTTELGSKRSTRTDALLADFDVIDRCEAHLGQLLLDELIARMPSGRAALATAARGATVPSTVGSSTVDCRPAKLAGIDTLDSELNALVASGTNGSARAGLITDLDGVLASAILGSHLSLTATAAKLDDTATSPRRLLAAHDARSVGIALGSTTRMYDLLALGRPIIGATGIDASQQTTQLKVAAHSLPIGLPQLWGMAWEDLSIAARLPALADPTVSGWIHACAAEAQRNAKVGCAAIEDLLCERTGASGCAGTLIAICTSAVSALADRVEGAFANEQILTVGGTVEVVDDDGDLVGNRLDGGTWAATGTLSQGLAFFGQRSTP